MSEHTPEQEQMVEAATSARRWVTEQIVEQLAEAGVDRPVRVNVMVYNGTGLGLDSGPMREPEIEHAIKKTTRRLEALGVSDEQRAAFSELAALLRAQVYAQLHVVKDRVVTEWKEHTARIDGEFEDYRALVALAMRAKGIEVVDENGKSMFPEFDDGRWVYVEEDVVDGEPASAAVTGRSG